MSFRPRQPRTRRRSVPAIRAYIDAEFVDVRGRHLREYLWILYKYRWLAATCFGVVFGLTCLDDAADVARLHRRDAACR